MLSVCDAGGNVVLPLKCASAPAADVHATLKERSPAIVLMLQEPVIFSGTVREAVDPFHTYPDDLVWEAIRRCRFLLLCTSLWP